MKINSNETTVRVLKNNMTLSKATEAISQNSTLEDSFFVCNVGEILRRYDAWTSALPSVRPFYTVRCNDSPLLLSILASLGSGFTCATKSEMCRLMELGVEPERIAMGSSIKSAAAVKYAASIGVDLTLVDTVGELHKLKAYHPTTKLVVEVKEGSLGVVEAALGLGLAVVGLGLESVEDLANAGGLLEAASALGATISVLHIPDAISDHNIHQVGEDAAQVKEDYGVSVAGSAGGFLIASGFTLCARVQGLRLRECDEGGVSPLYYIAEGVYGAFAMLLAGDNLLPPAPVKAVGKGRRREVCDVVGPTWDPLDVVLRDVLLPRMKPGDWLAFPRMGCLAQPVPHRVHYLVEEHHRCRLLSLDISLGAFEVGAEGATSFCRPRRAPAPQPKLVE